MLRLEVQLTPEGWDEKTETFVPPKVQVLQLEHSLVSLSKWESKWCKPFLNGKPKTDEEVTDYIKFMTLTQNVDPEVYDHLSAYDLDKIEKYIDAPMTATTFSEDGKGKANREIVTAEIIYYWMIALNVPFECQKWHLNRLITLIRVCNIKNTPAKKMNKKDILSRNAKLNAARRQQLNTRG
jgi:hypothetical protein